MSNWERLDPALRRGPSLQRVKFQIPGKNKRKFFFGTLAMGRKVNSSIVDDRGRIHQVPSELAFLPGNIPVKARAHAEEDEE